MRTRKVHVVNGNPQYLSMFLERGWEVVSSVEEADLVQFTGGEDVAPAAYGEDAHPYTRSNSHRDAQEARVFKLCTTLGKPMAGVCRGGQFLNVMCGGKLFQHVNNHAIAGTHMVINLVSGGMIPSTSTHHQMMRAGEKAEIIGVASESTVCEHMDGGAIKYHEPDRGTDVEVLLYPDDKVLCFQPHPEYMDGDSKCQQWYFSLIEDKLLKEVR